MNKILTKYQQQIGYILIASFIIALLLNSIVFYVFLSISPALLVGLIIFIYNIYFHNFNKTNIRFKKAIFIPLMFFIFAMLLSAIFAYNSLLALKVILKILIIIFSFSQFNILYNSLESSDRAKQVCIYTILAYAGLTLLLYIISLVYFNFNFDIENTFSIGIMIDRKMPRLISLASKDPNITAAYFTIILAFLFSQKKDKKNILGICLYLLLTLLTLSRGGILALSFLLITYSVFIIKNTKYKIGLLIFPVIVLLVVTFTIFNRTNFGSSTIVGTIIDRFSESISDGGSGRLKIWKKSAETFANHMWVGIGPNNSLAYNTDVYNLHKYTHNSYLEILSETGIIGSACFATLIIIVIISNIKTAAKDKFPLYATVALLISILFLSLLYTEIFFFIISLALFGWKHEQ